MKIKRFYENFEDELYEEEPDNIYDIVVFDSPNITEGSFYILQDIKDEHSIILLHDYEYSVKPDNVNKYYKIASKEELDKYIYNNKYPILINEKDKNGRSYFNKYLWVFLPKDIKDNL